MYEVRRNAETRVGVIVNLCENGQIADPRLPAIAIAFLWPILRFEDTCIKIIFENCEWIILLDISIA